MLFLGYTTARKPAEAAMMVYTYWGFEGENPPATSYSLALRVYDGDATLEERRFEMGLPESSWTQDKLFVRWFNLPESALDLENQTQLGIYRKVDGVLARTMNQDTGIPGTAIDLTLSGD
jgi:hypothetical protein